MHTIKLGREPCSKQDVLEEFFSVRVSHTVDDVDSKKTALSSLFVTLTECGCHLHWRFYEL